MDAAVLSIVYHRSRKIDMTGSSLKKGVRTHLDHIPNVIYAYLNKRHIFQYTC
jgi:hypothetical protein